MIRRPLGSTPFTVSAVGFGAFGIGGWMWGGQEDDASVRAIHAGLDAGVTWIDTAPIYGSGKADAVVARAVGERPADRRPLIFTKFGHHLIDGQRVTDGSAARVIADCEYALRTFGVDAIDLFQLHWPTPQPVAETAAACADLVRSGKVRAIGVCNHSVAQCEAWIAAGGPLHSVQNLYHLFKPEAAGDVIPWCAAHGVGFLAHSPLFRGMLFGSWTPDRTFAAGDHRGERADFRGRRLARFLAAVEEVKAIAEDDDQTCAELAIGCLMCSEGLSGCIVGARNPEQGAFLGNLGMPAKQAQLDAIDGIVRRLHADLAIIGDA